MIVASTLGYLSQWSVQSWGGETMAKKLNQNILIFSYVIGFPGVVSVVTEQPRDIERAAEGVSREIVWGKCGERGPSVGERSRTPSVINPQCLTCKHCDKSGYA